MYAKPIIDITTFSANDLVVNLNTSGFIDLNNGVEVEDEL